MVELMLADITFIRGKLYPHLVYLPDQSFPTLLPTHRPLSRRRGRRTPLSTS